MDKKLKVKSDKDLVRADDKTLTKEEKVRKDKLMKMPDIAPLAISRHNATFRKKMWKLARGIREGNTEYVTEIKEYFARYNMQLAYNAESDKIRLVAQGAVPVDFKVDEFAEKPQ